MVVFRRRRGRQDRPAQPTGLAPDAAAERILATAEGVLGPPVRLAEGPEAVLAGAGPDAYTFTLDTDDERWSGQLVARTSAEDLLRRESEWLRAVGALGFGVPEVLHDHPEQGILVFRPPGGENLVNLMTTELTSLPQLLASFGRLHARLHRLPVDGLPGTRADGDGNDGGDGGDDVLDPVDELAELAGALGVRKAVDRELGWLRSHLDDRAAGPTVACHGDLHPAHVFVWRGDDAREVTVNWTRARLGEAPYDVAGTLVSFWTGPLFVANVAQRTMLKMARDSLASAYQSAYETEAGGPLDTGTLAHWQALHLCHLAVHLVDVVQGTAPGPWHPAANVPQPDKALQDVRNRFWELAEEA